MKGISQSKKFNYISLIMWQIIACLLLIIMLLSRNISVVSLVILGFLLGGIFIMLTHLPISYLDEQLIDILETRNNMMHQHHHRLRNYITLLEKKLALIQTDAHKKQKKVVRRKKSK